MKTPGWIASGIGAVVVVCGDIWGVRALTNDEPETAYTGAYEPAITETPEASTEPVETPTVEPSEAPETVEPTPTVEYTEAESEYLYGAHQVLSYRQIDLPDAELLTAGYAICDALEAGEQLSDIRIIDGLEGTVLHNDLNATTRNQLCD